MVNVLIEQLGCPFCLNMKKAILFLNITRPMGEKIMQANIRFGDRKIDMMDKIYKTKEWGTPQTLLETKNLKRVFNTYSIMPETRIALNSAYWYPHTINLIRIFKNEHIILY